MRAVTPAIRDHAVAAFGPVRRPGTVADAPQAHVNPRLPAPTIARRKRVGEYTCGIDTLVAERFPLVPRVQPVCRTLPHRVQRVAGLARAAAQHDAGSVVLAAEAYFHTAMILGDTGMEDLARDVCWRQHDIFATHPRDADHADAILALQPLIDIGRLYAESGHGAAANEIYLALLRAVQGRTVAVVDGRTVRVADFVQPGFDHREAFRWLRQVVLTDGSRALAGVGRWDEAVIQVREHGGLGVRLLDGRQVAILAHRAAGRVNAARRLLDTSEITAGWEDMVAGCLAMICMEPDDASAVTAREEMTDIYVHEARHADDLRFLVRAGLAVAALVRDTSKVDDLADIIEGAALDTGDAYLARDILAARAPLPLTRNGRSALIRMCDEAALGVGTIPDDLLHTLMTSLDICDDAIAASDRDRQPASSRGRLPASSRGVGLW